MFSATPRLVSRHEHLLAVIVAAIVSAWVALTVLLAAMPAWGALGLIEPTNMWERAGWDGWRAHMMVFWPVFLLLAVVALVALGLKLYRELWPGALHVHPRSPVASGHRILAERFARGEIDEAEYHAKRKALGKR